MLCREVIWRGTQTVFPLFSRPTAREQRMGIRGSLIDLRMLIRGPSFSGKYSENIASVGQVPRENRRGSMAKKLTESVATQTAQTWLRAVTARWGF